MQAADGMINRHLLRRQMRSSGTDPSSGITSATSTSSAASTSTGIHHLCMSAVVDNLQGAHQAWWTPELMPRVVRLHSSAHLIVLSARTQQADAYNKKLDPESMTQSALYMRLADAKPHDVLKSAPYRWCVARISRLVASPD